MQYTIQYIQNSQKHKVQLKADSTKHANLKFSSLYPKAVVINVVDETTNEEVSLDDFVKPNKSPSSPPTRPEVKDQTSQEVNLSMKSIEALANRISKDNDWSKKSTQQPASLTDLSIGDWCLVIFKFWVASLLLSIIPFAILLAILNN